MIYKLLTQQPRAKDRDQAQIGFIHSVATYMLKSNKTNFMVCLKLLGTLFNTYHIPIERGNLKPLKTKILKSDILRALAKFILNESGHNDSLGYLLNLLISYENNQNNN